MAMSTVVIVRMRSNKLGRLLGENPPIEKTGDRTQREQTLKVSCLAPMGMDAVNSCEGAHIRGSEIKKIDGFVTSMRRSSITLLPINCDSGHFELHRDGRGPQIMVSGVCRQ